MIDNQKEKNSMLQRQVKPLQLGGFTVSCLLTTEQKDSQLLSSCYIPPSSNYLPALYFLFVF